MVVSAYTNIKSYPGCIYVCNLTLQSGIQRSPETLIETKDTRLFYSIVPTHYTPIKSLAEILCGCLITNSTDFTHKKTFE